MWFQQLLRSLMIQSLCYSKQLLNNSSNYWTHICLMWTAEHLIAHIFKRRLKRRLEYDLSRTAAENTFDTQLMLLNSDSFVYDFGCFLNDFWCLNSWFPSSWLPAFLDSWILQFLNFSISDFLDSLILASRVGNSFLYPRISNILSFYPEGARRSPALRSE